MTYDTPHAESYVFKIGPDYTVAHYYTPTDAVCLDEWTGRTLEDFNAGMIANGWQEPDEHRYTLPGRGEIREYTYSRRR